MGCVEPRRARLVGDPGVEYTLIETASDLDAYVSRHLGTTSYALDTEFEQRTTYHPRLALLQICCDDEVALVDPTVVDSSPLGALLDSPAVAVVHAAVNDLDLVESAVGVRPRHLLDTEVGGQLLGRPRTSLAALTRDYLGLRLDKSEQTRDWLLRPLPERALRYAAADVAYLVELSERLSEDLVSCDRAEAWREESDAVLRDDSAGDELALWWRVKGLSRAPSEVRLRGQYLCVARDTLARQRDLVRTRVLSDEDLLEVAFRPASLATLSVSRDEVVRQHLEGALDAAAGADPDELWPADADVSDGARGRRLALMRLVAKEVADEWSLSSATLATHRDLVRFERGLPSRLDRVWRQRAFGDQMSLIRENRGALGLLEGRLRVVEMNLDHA